MHLMKAAQQALFGNDKAIQPNILKGYEKAHIESMRHRSLVNALTSTYQVDKQNNLLIQMQPGLVELHSWHRLPHNFRRPLRATIISHIRYSKKRTFITSHWKTALLFSKNSLQRLHASIRKVWPYILLRMKLIHIHGILSTRTTKWKILKVKCIQ